MGNFYTDTIAKDSRFKSVKLFEPSPRLALTDEADVGGRHPKNGGEFAVERFNPSDGQNFFDREFPERSMSALVPAVLLRRFPSQMHWVATAKVAVAARVGSFLTALRGAVAIFACKATNQSGFTIKVNVAITGTSAGIRPDQTLVARVVEHNFPQILKWGAPRRRGFSSHFRSFHDRLWSGPSGRMSSALAALFLIGREV